MAPMSELGMEVPSFLGKLWDMLDDASNAHVIVWDPEGTMFAVNSPKQMGAQILGKYFRHNNFASFQRQLNYFGFHKCGKSESGCYYKHASFLRSDPAEMLKIQRKTNHSSSSAKAAASAGAGIAGGGGTKAGAGRPGLAMAAAPPVGRPRLAVAKAPLGAAGGKRGLSHLNPASSSSSSSGAARSDKRQRMGSGLYINDPGLVPVTPLTPIGGLPGRSFSWDSAASASPSAASAAAASSAASSSASSMMLPPSSSPRVGARSSPRLSAAVAAAAQGASPRKR